MLWFSTQMIQTLIQYIKSKFSLEMCFLRTKFSFSYIHCHKKWNLRINSVLFFILIEASPGKLAHIMRWLEPEGVLLLDCHFFQRLLSYMPRITAIFSQTHFSWSAGVKSNNFFLNTAESKELKTSYLATVICFFIFWKVQKKCFPKTYQMLAGIAFIHSLSTALLKSIY